MALGKNDQKKLSRTQKENGSIRMGDAANEATFGFPEFDN